MAEPLHSPASALPADWLEQQLAAAASARVAVFGDLCLDAYWCLDETKTECSIETGLPVQAVATQRYSPGGAGNVAANVRALGAGDVRLIGAVGTDLFGGELLAQCRRCGLATDQIEAAAEWSTLVYAKPYRGAAELSRLDFGGSAVASAALLNRMMNRIEAAAASYPVVVINQQVSASLAAILLPRIAALVSRYPRTRFLVDSRHCADRFPGAALKLNRAEAARLLGLPLEASGDAAVLARLLADRQGNPVLVTAGAEGLSLAMDGEIHRVPGIALPGPIDPVGAGDAALAGFALALATQTAPLPAACFANLAAAVTTRQVRTTGLAHAALLRSGISFLS